MRRIGVVLLFGIAFVFLLGAIACLPGVAPRGEASFEGFVTCALGGGALAMAAIVSWK